MPRAIPLRDLKLAGALLLLIALVAWLLPRWMEAAEDSEASASLERPSAMPAAAGSSAPTRSGGALPVALGRELPPPTALESLVFDREPPAAPLLSGVQGRVTDEADSGLAGVTVRIYFEMGAERELLGVTHSTTGGEYRLEVDLDHQRDAIEHRWLDELERAARWQLEEDRVPRSVKHLVRSMAKNSRNSRHDLPRVCAEVRHPGRESARATRTLRAGDELIDLLNLRLRPGSGLSGTVFHVGTPLPSATVQLFDEAWKHLRTTTTDGEGKYRLGLPEAGAYHVHARFDGLGASGVDAFTLGANLTPLEIDLDLGGEGILLARVMLPDRTPIPGLRMQALQYGLFQGELFGGRAVTPGELARAEAGGGLAWSEQRSDSEGRVLFGGLQQGMFGLRLPELKRPELQPAESFSTGATEHEVLLDVWVLVVEIENGQMGHGDRGRPRVQRAGLGGVELLVQPEMLPGSRGWRPPVRAFTDGLGKGASFLVEPGETYRVYASGRAGDDERRVRIKESRRITRIKLRLEEPSEEIRMIFEMAGEEPPGMLVLDLRDESGSRIKKAKVRITRDDDDRRVVFEERIEPFSGGIPLLPGDYIVEFLFDPTDERMLYMPEPRTRVTVRAMEAVQRRASPRQGARIELRLESMPGVRAARRRASQALGLVLRPLEGGGAELHPRFVAEDGAGRGSPAIWPGERARTEVLPPGRYELLLGGEEFAAAPVEIELRAGELEVVEPRLAQRD